MESWFPEAWEFRPAPRRALGVFERWPSRRHALVPVLIALSFFAISLLQWNVPAFDGSASGAAVYARGEWWRIFSALFVHGDLGHLASNLLPFLFFGWMIQAYFGFWLFPAFSFLVGMVSNAVTVALYPPGSHLVGASGMIYGMIALWLVLYLRFDKERRPPVRAMRAVGFALLLLFPTTYEPQVSYLAHASGFAAGMAGGFIALPFVSPRHPS